MTDSPGFGQAGVPPKKRSNKKLFIIIGVVLIIPIVLTIAIVAIVVGAVFVGAKSVDEYQCAISEVKTNKVAIEMLGEPIEEGFFMFPDIEIAGPRRDVNFTITVSGPKDSRTLFVSSRRDVFRSNFMMALRSSDEGSTVLYNGSYPCQKTESE